jgi:predicted Zn-dependent protease
LDEPGLPDPREKVGSYERLQVALLSQGPQAVRALPDALAIEAQDPRNPLATFTVASLAYRLGRLGLAAEAFQRTVALDPERPSTRAYYGHLLRDMGRLGLSERELKVALEQSSPDDPSTRASLAATLLEEGKLPEARGLLAPLLPQAQGSVEVQESYGLLLEAEGHPEEARAHLEQAAQDGDVDRSLELAHLHLALRDSRKAEEGAAGVLSRSPGHPWALALLGHALILEGRREPGLRTLGEAFARNPLRPRVWRSLADAYRAAGDAASADRCTAAADALLSGTGDPRGRGTGPAR